jgi:aryl-alcohol dehydrogenase-like predicted oxidoreductase
MSDMALCFILMNEIVSTVIPGMRKIRHVETNLAVSDGRGLPDSLTGPTDGIRARMPPADKEEA